MINVRQSSGHRALPPARALGSHAIFERIGLLGAGLSEIGRAERLGLARDNVVIDAMVSPGVCAFAGPW